MPDYAAVTLYHGKRNLRWSAAIKRAMDQGRAADGAVPDSEDDSGLWGAEGSGAPPTPLTDASSARARPASPRGWIATGWIDRPSVLAAVGGGIAYLALACLSLLVSRAGDTVSPVWLPNACAVALLLRARLGNEVPFLIACCAASLAANGVVGLPDHIALVFSLANIVEIAVVAGLARTALRPQPDMNRLSDLARFVWAGGLAGPLASAVLTAPVMGTTLPEVQAGMMTWFLTDSMAMILIVPVALLLADRIAGRLPPGAARPAEAAALLAGGMVIAFLVFDQTLYPLVFLQ